MGRHLSGFSFCRPFDDDDDDDEFRVFLRLTEIRRIWPLCADKRQCVLANLSGLAFGIPGDFNSLFVYVGSSINLRR